MIEILLIAGILILTLILLRYNFYASLILALVLSTFLHKELFSIYIWDMLPIRIFMGAFLINSFYDFVRFNGISFKFVKYLKDPFILLNVLLLISKLVSMVNTQNLTASLSLNAFNIAITVFVITIYLKLDADQILGLFKSYIPLAAILSFITFVQLFFYFKYSFLFGAILNIAGNTVDFPAFSLSKEFFNDSLKLVVMTRVGSIFWDVNHFGGFLAGLVVPLLALVLTLKKNRNLNIFYFFILNLTLFLTNSRSAWILAGVAYLIFFVFAVYKKIGKKGIAYSLFGFGLFSLLLFFMYQDKDSYFREKVRSYFHYRLDSFDSHFLLLQGTVEVFNKFPLIGGGTGSFFEHFKTTPSSNDFLRRDPAGLSVRVPAHSIWGESLSEAGAVGTSIFVLIVLLNLGYLLYSIIHSKDNSDFLLLSAFFGTIIGWLISGIFYSFNSEFFYILFFFPVMYSIKKNNLILEEVLLYFKKKSFYATLILFSICFYMVFINIGANKLIAFDEAIYAKVAKNMFETGDLMTLTWKAYDINWFEKPSLYFILTSFAYSLFGVSEFAARFVTACFSIVCLAYVYKLGKELKDSVTGYFSVLAMILNVSYLYYSRTAMLDVILTAFITASVFYFLKAQKGNKLLNLSLSGSMVGLAVMTKSIVGFLPLGIYFLYYIYTLIKKENTYLVALKELSLLTGVSLLVCAPWHFYMWYLHGSDFINSYFGYHLFKRYTSAIEDKGGPWYYYFVVIRNTMRLWFLVLIPSLAYFIYKAYKENFSNEKILILISAVIVMLFFSTSSSKLKWYIMPIYPFLAIICGYFVSEAKELLFKKTKSLVIAFVASYLFIVANIFYFYTQRDMVYTGDLTGRIVTLIQKNNELPKKEVEYSYFDKTDYPVALYYSEKPFELADFSPLKQHLTNLKKDNNGVIMTNTFVTSQSRFRSLKNTFPELTIISENKDYVLGSLTVY